MSVFRRTISTRIELSGEPPVTFENVARDLSRKFDDFIDAKAERQGEKVVLSTYPADETVPVSFFASIYGFILLGIATGFLIVPSWGVPVVFPIVVFAVFSFWVFYLMAYILLPEYRRQIAHRDTVHAFCEELGLTPPSEE